MPTTPLLGLPYPAAGAAPNVPLDIQLLAQATETSVAGEWVPYTPTLGTAWTLGNGTLSGRYKEVGKTVHYSVVLIAGTTTTIGAGGTGIGLPRGRFPRSVDQVVGRGLYLDASASGSAARYFLEAVLAGSIGSTCSLFMTSNGVQVAPGSPVTIAVGDAITFGGVFERS